MKRKKIIISLLSMIVSINTLSACTNNDSTLNYDGINYYNDGNEYVQLNDDKTFVPGEHIIMIPINDPTKSIEQYKSHAGYKPIAIDTAEYGNAISLHAGSCIVFVNYCDVNCKSTGINQYNDFGTPINYENTDTIETEEEKEFLPYEHIISVPINKYNNIGQLEYHEGYELIGIANSFYGEVIKIYHGGCLLYTNTTNVICKSSYDSNGVKKYISFGTPVEKEITRQLN